MSDVDVVEQLGMYGAWLEVHEAVELRPPGEVLLNDSSASAQPEVRITMRRRSVVVAVTAIAVIVAGIAAVHFLRRPGSQNVTAFMADDPPGPLYVLPESESGFTLTNSHVETNEEPVEGPIEFVVVGSRVDGTFRDIATLQLVRSRPELRTDWVDTDSVGGPAQHTGIDGFMTAVTRQHGELWLIVMTGPDRLVEALEVLDGSDVTEDGKIELSSELADLLVDRVMIDGSTEISSTYAEISSDSADGSLIVVETATTPTPLIGLGTLGSVISETTVQGKPGWRLNRQDQDGDWNGIAWQASPNRMIAVSGHAPIHDIIEVVETLTIVDEKTWTSAIEPSS